MLVATLALALQAQTPNPVFTAITAAGRRAVPAMTVNGQELIALDELAGLVGAAVRDDAVTGGVAVNSAGRTAVLSPNQAIASVNGQIIALSSPVVRTNGRWYVPIDFIPRGLARITDIRVELRRASRLLVVGSVTVPRVSIRVDAVGTGTRATLDLAPAVEVTTSTEPGVVRLDVAADAIDTTLPAAASGLIARFRQGAAPTTIEALLADTAGTVRVARSATATGARLVIDIQRADAAVAAPSPGATAAAPAAGPAAAPPAAGAGPPAGEAPVLPAAPGNRLRTIVLDAGHGGDDVGARGTGGIVEKQVTLDTARRVRAVLEATLGVRVLLTRDGDQAVPLPQRTALANNNKADVFISLHANAAFSPGRVGASVLHVRLSDDDATAATLGPPAVLPLVGGGTRRLEFLRSDLAQAGRQSDSAILAAVLAEELGTRISMSDQPVQTAPLHVLTGAAMPSVLVELGYLSNADQAGALASESYQTAVAQAIAATLVRYRPDAGTGDDR